MTERGPETRMAPAKRPNEETRLLPGVRMAVARKQEISTAPAEALYCQISDIHHGIGVDASGLDQEFYERRITTEEE